MKPARFAYARPESIDDALALLAEHGDRATILSGGQSLVPLLNLRVVRPDVLVDVSRLPGLDGIEVSDEAVAVGALTRQAAVARSPAVAEHVPTLAAAMRYVGHAATRNRGTFGGMIAHADPSTEGPAVLLALGGEVVAQGHTGTRTLSGDTFFLGSRRTALAEDEILTQVRLRRQPPGARWAFDEVARRHNGLALVGLAATAEPDASGTYARVRVVFFGVGSTPVRVPEAEAILLGSSVADASIAEQVGRAAAEAIPATSDVHASAEYRREIAAVLAQRAVQRFAAQGATS